MPEPKIKRDYVPIVAAGVVIVAVVVLMTNSHSNTVKIAAVNLICSLRNTSNEIDLTNCHFIFYI